MLKIIIFLLLFLPVLLNAEESKQNDWSEIVGMMVVAKATGMCGALSQLVTFQDTTKMKGGDEFIMRFLETEAARLGYTVDSFVSQCPDVTKKYKEYMKLLNFNE
jgi:hypothetical protein